MWKHSKGITRGTHGEIGDKLPGYSEIQPERGKLWEVVDETPDGCKGSLIGREGEGKLELSDG